MLIEPFLCLRQRFSDWNSTEWSSVTLSTVFSHIYRTITSQQFCHAERSKTNWIGWRRNSRIWVYPHPDDHTNHTTQSIHNKTTDMSCAVRVYVLVLNCHRCTFRVNNFAVVFSKNRKCFKNIGTNSLCFRFLENNTKSVWADLFLSCHFCLA